MILGLIFYGYCTGVFSSRKIERATFDSIAFRYISGDHHPDHDTINSFRKRFLPQIGELFKQILIFATEAGVLKIGNVSFDGTKVNANASKHKALSKIKKMRRKLSSEKGKEIYRYRKMTVEPVFGIIKQATGFRRFSFRGQEKVSREWGLVCLAYNLRRLFTLNMAV